MMRCSTPLTAALLFLLASACQGQSETGKATSEVRTDDWPTDNAWGDFAPIKRGLKLLDDISKARRLWLNPTPMGFQKNNTRDPGAFYGGTSGLIVADGRVFGTFIRPSGEVLNEHTTNRYYKTPGDFPKSMRQIDADDVTVCIDAETGKTLWTAEEKGVGMNFLFGKRGHYGITPCWNVGTVYVFGSLGMVYAYDAKTGEKRWGVATPCNEQGLKVKAEAMTGKTLLDLYGNKNNMFHEQRMGLMVSGGVLLVPDMNDGLLGLDPGNGNVRWKLPRVLARGISPSVWRGAGRELLLCPVRTSGTAGKVTLVDPADGKVLWTLDGLGPQHCTLVLSGNIVLLNTRGNLDMGEKGPGGDEAKATGLYAGYELSLAGAKRLWTLEDDPKCWHSVRPDRGRMRRTAIRDGVAYMILGAKDAGLFLTRVDLATGKVLQRLELVDANCASTPLVLEDRVLVQKDLAHASGGAGFNWFTIEGDGTLRPAGQMRWNSIDVLSVNDYELLAETPYCNGRIYTKTEKGVAAIDLRQ